MTLEHCALRALLPSSASARLAAASLAAALALAAPGAGAALTVRFTEPVNFSDAGERVADRERTTAFIERHLQGLAAAHLPADFDLDIEFLDVDLAGRLAQPGRASSAVRVIGNLDWPRFQVRYTLRHKGRAWGPYDETLSDGTFRDKPPRVHDDAPFAYERRLLDEWFARRFSKRPVAAASGERIVAFRVRVPEGTPALYLSGNVPALGPWSPSKFALQGTGRERTGELAVAEGTVLEFKFTLGSWDREALGPSGMIPPNHRLKVDGDKEVSLEIASFKKDSAAYLDTWRESGVLGTLDYWRGVRSQHLELPRHVAIWLPPGYDADPSRRYPVLYMHDGQNLFDPRLANTGTDWGVDEAVVRGAQAGRIPPVIVVGVFNTDQRAREYSPWDLGPRYARFLVEELMPEVNRRYRTLTGPANTATMGSSMGGLIAFHLCRTQPQVFGQCGCLSTHFPYSAEIMERLFPGTSRGLALPPASAGTPLIDREVAAGATMPRGVRLYFDYGTRGLDAQYEPVQRRVDAWLVGQGLREGTDFVSRRVDGADHNEAAWRARLDEPLAFLFGNRPR